MITQKIGSTELNVVSINDAMEHSRITDSYDEIMVQMTLDAAHDLVESWLNRKLVPTVMVGVADLFERKIILPYPPVQEIVTVTVLDKNEELIVVDDTNFRFDPVRSVLTFTKAATRILVGTTELTITFNCGYQSVDVIPAAVKHAIRMTFATLYEVREDVVVGTQINTVPLTARNILKAHRVRSIH
jgi:uncharacterized phiE125 gp8 family phage protein